MNLNNLIQRIEAMGDIIATDEWKNAIFPTILSIEQINAFALEANEELTVTDKDFVEDRLRELEHIVGKFETQGA